MSSYPSEAFKSEPLHNPTMHESPPQSNQYVIPTPSGPTYRDVPPQAYGNSYEHFDGQYQHSSRSKNTAPLTPGTALGPHMESIPHDSIVDTTHQPQSFSPNSDHPGISYPTSRTHHDYAEAFPNASWPTSEHDNRFSLPSARQPLPLEGLSSPNTTNLVIPGPHLIPERRPIHPASFAQSRHAPVTAFHQSLDASAIYLLRESPSTATLEGYDRLNTVRSNSPLPPVTNDTQARNALGVPILTRKRSGEALRDTQSSRKRCKPGGPSSDISSNHGNDTPEQRSTNEQPSLSRHELGRTSIQSGSSSGPAPVKATNGFFSKSSHFVVERSILMDNSQHHHAQGDQPDGTLLWLEGYVMEGAEFDSSARDPPPRCHPNTRASIIERTINWVKDPDQEKKMRWVRGHAGVGKSAIVQTVFESLPEEIRGGSVFFSRPGGRNNPNEVFPSIAYQLGVRNLPYRAYLKELMLKDPKSLNKSMKEQFRLLFVEPFAKRKLLDGHATSVVALDGLDECGGDPTRNDTDQSRFRGRSSEVAQREIVDLISAFILQHPSVPLIWIIASRPEKHLKAAFGDEKVKSTFSPEEIPVDSVEACRDVEIYLNAEFTRIQKDHDDFITANPWPSSKDFSLITAKAAGLFMFAQVVIRFIDESNPIQQLKYALAAISKVSSSEMTENPLVVLDAMYTEIISKVPANLLEPALRIIGSIAQCDRRIVSKSNNGNLPNICNILDISQDVALTALRHLHSVLYFPKGMQYTRPYFYHTSFRDFLEDESRSHEFSIREDRVCDDMFKGLMRFSDFSGDESPEANPWVNQYSLQGLVTMAKKNDPSNLLKFQASIFGKQFPVSEAVVLPLLLNHDFAMKPGFEAISLNEKLLQIHERHGITRREPFDSLGITFDSVSEGKIIRTGPYCFVVSLKGFDYSPSIDEENQDGEIFRQALCRYLEAGPKRMVRVWGQKRLKRSAVFEFRGAVDSDLSYYVAVVGF